MKILAIIPARGGSKGIPRKNIRLMHGKPLIAYAIKNAIQSQWITDIVVSTDDEEIADIAFKYGSLAIIRPDELGKDDVTLDPVIYHAVSEYERENGAVDIVVTMQPTSPLLKSETLDSAIKSFISGESDTIISAINKPHLAWKEEGGQFLPLYKERLNRQYLPKHLTETGSFVISKRQNIAPYTRIGSKIDLYEIPEDESIDIDEYSDWIICETKLAKRKIIIRTEGYPEIGLGHIYRSILMADNFVEHDVRVVVSEKSKLGIQKIQERFIKHEVIQKEEEFFDILNKYKPDILINDILDTSSEYMRQVKKLVPRVVNFEDIGVGSRYADAVINALYEEEEYRGNIYWGEKYYCLRDEFLISASKEFSERVNNILILFGGTDPAGFTEKMLKVIKDMPDEDVTYQFVLGLGFDREKEFHRMMKEINKDIQVVKNVKMVSKYMEKADIAVSSQGRTMYELANMAVPTIILSQNDREITHKFGDIRNGFINLGNGKDVQEETIRDTILWLMNTPQIRRQLSENMKNLDLSKGIYRVKNIILGNGELE